ncbi:MAG: hypothetical protein ABL894_10050 [Hyphomicrobium sp.]
MFFRWVMVYVMTVLMLILGAFAGWQQQVIVAADERHKVALEKFDALEIEAEAARREADNASRNVIELKNEFEREKKLLEVQAAKPAAASQALTEALEAKSAAEAARDAAEARLATELAAKPAAEQALIDAIARAEAAMEEADAAKTELSRLQDEKSQVTGTIAPPATTVAPSPAAPVDTALPAGTTATPDPADAIDDAAKAEPGAPATTADTGTVEPNKQPSDANSKKDRKAKPPVKSQAAKSRPKPKPKTDDSFFSN